MLIKELDCNVVEAAERRIYELFQKNKTVSMSFSGGKDSICMSDVMIKTMQKYGISFSRLIVLFIDEEAIYPDIEQMVLDWRSKFLSLGAKFYWFCLPVKHYNCCNKLEQDESFICWEPGKESVWVRPMPKFAIRNHASFKMGMTYQEFVRKIFKTIPQVVGLRMSESVQRRSTITSMKSVEKYYYPIYDWKDRDVWLYIQRTGLQIPVSYIYLYKVGVPLNKLRISQFFSIDTIKSLPKVLEFYPDLYQRIIAREPNADLVMLYWETDMFRSSRQDEKFEQVKDYKRKFLEEMKRATAYPDDYPGYSKAKKLYMKLSDATSEKTYRSLYQLLIAGDPKNRTYRALCGQIQRDVELRDGVIK
jgi:predicted phosphoadenosine phosphosulfate sulfurtransferase